MSVAEEITEAGAAPLAEAFPLADHQQAPGGSPFPAIADYGFLSDCEVSALVASSGNIEWMCLPRMDGPSVFAAMLDRGAGRFRLGPADAQVPASRRYLPGTMIMETTWSAPTGWTVVRDALLVGPWPRQPPRTDYQRAPADHQAEHVLLRTVECLEGAVDLVLECSGRFTHKESASKHLDSKSAKFSRHRIYVGSKDDR